MKTVETKLIKLMEAPSYELDESMCDEELVPHPIESKESPNRDSKGDIVELLDDIVAGEFGLKNHLIVEFGTELGNHGYALRKEGFEGILVGVDIYLPVLERCAARGIYDYLLYADASEIDIHKELADLNLEYDFACCCAMDFIEHVPLVKVQKILDAIYTFPLGFIASPVTLYGQEDADGENKYQRHVRCYDPLEQVLHWKAVDVVSCSPGGVLCTMHSHVTDPPKARLLKSPITFKGWRGRVEIYDRLKSEGIKPNRDRARVRESVREVMRGLGL